MHNAHTRWMSYEEVRREELPAAAIQIPTPGPSIRKPHVWINNIHRLMEKSTEIVAKEALLTYLHLLYVMVCTKRPGNWAIQTVAPDVAEVALIGVTYNHNEVLTLTYVSAHTSARRVSDYEVETSLNPYHIGGSFTRTWWQVETSAKRTMQFNAGKLSSSESFAQWRHYLSGGGVQSSETVNTWYDVMREGFSISQCSLFIECPERSVRYFFNWSLKIIHTLYRYKHRRSFGPFANDRQPFQVVRACQRGLPSATWGWLVGWLQMVQMSQVRYSSLLAVHSYPRSPSLRLWRTQYPFLWWYVSSHRCFGHIPTLKYIVMMR